MMKLFVKNFFCTLCIVLTYNIYAQSGQKLIKTKITENISVSVPQDFTKLTDPEVLAKYLTYRKPLAVFSDPTRKVDFSINDGVTAWQPDDLEMLQKFYKASIQNIYSEVQFSREEIITQDGKRFLVFEFVSTMRDDDKSKTSAFSGGEAIVKYSLIQYTMLGEQLLIFNFTCPVALKSSWQKTATDLMKEIKISQ